MSDAAPSQASSAQAAATPKPGAEIAHATRGRVRLKIPSARRNPELLHQIWAAFDNQPGIDAVDVKPDSCCLVIYYDPDHHQNVQSLFVNLDKVATVFVDPAAAARAHRQPTFGFDDLVPLIEGEAEFLAAHSDIATAVVSYVKALDRQIKRSTGNNIDLEILAPVGLAAFTFMEIGAAAATPMWVTLMVFSIAHFTQLHYRDADKT
jgi:hypothetical protein